MAVHKTIDGVKLDEETYAAVKKMADHGIGKGRGERQSATIAEMCAALVHTGVFRRIAANKWAKAHPAPKAEKKPKAAKKASAKKPAKAKKVKKSVKKGSKKPARASKPKAAKKETAPTNSASPASSAPPATGGGVLD